MNTRMLKKTSLKILLLTGTLLLSPLASTHAEEKRAETYTLQQVLSLPTNERITETKYVDLNNDGIMDLSLTIERKIPNGTSRVLTAYDVRIYMGNIQDGKYRLKKAD